MAGRVLNDYMASNIPIGEQLPPAYGNSFPERSEAKSRPFG